MSELMPLGQARKLVLDSVKPLDVIENIHVVNCLGRVLGRDVAAILEVPPFDRAAMDGYALISSDTSRASAGSPVSLQVAGSVFAGSGDSLSILHGLSAYITTGSPIPCGADSVVRVEKVRRSGDRVYLDSPVLPYENIAPAGEDIRKGETVLNAGEILTPAKAGLLASQGLTEIEVYAKPKVAIITTGEELARPPAELKPGQIYDINSVTLANLATGFGAVPTLLPVASDSLPALEHNLNLALEYDLVIISGGSSVGERDFTSKLLSEKGRVFFHGLSIKPGKPTLFALVGSKPVISLPGYPTSCLIASYLLVVPALEKMTRKKNIKPVVTAVLASAVKPANRLQLVPVQVKNGEAYPVEKESGNITASSRADGYITVGENQPGTEGSVVDVEFF